MTNGQTILLMGPTGAGKDTQAQLITKELGYRLIRTGDLVRAQTPHNTIVTEQLRSGEMVDDDLVNDLVASFINQCKPSDTILSDGFPRRLAQALWFDEFLAESSRKVDLALILNVSEEIILTRLTKRQRHDDQQSVVRHRLALYMEQTRPVIDYYSTKGIVVEIDGMATIEEVHKKIISELKKVTT